MTAWAGRFTPQARVAVQTSTRTPPTKFKTHKTAIQIHTIQSIEFFHFTAKPLKGIFTISNENGTEKKETNEMVLNLCAFVRF